MWAKLLSFIPGLSITTWLVIVGGLVAGTNIITASKIWSYQEQKIQNLILNTEVKIITKEKQVLVLDQKTLTEAINKADRTARQDERNKLAKDNLIKNDPTATTRECLNPDELREWNNENTGIEVHNNTGPVHEVGEVRNNLSSSN